MAALWTYSEQQNIRPISANNEALFAKLALEVQVTELQDLLGFEFYQDMVQNPASTANATLLAGDSWTSGGITYTFNGLKYVLAYFFFARYITESRNFDTFVGLIRKELPEGEPLNEGSIRNLENKYRKIAGSYWKECEQYLIDNASDYLYFYGTNPGPRSRNNGCFNPDDIITL